MNENHETVGEIRNENAKATEQTADPTEAEHGAAVHAHTHKKAKSERLAVLIGQSASFVIAALVFLLYIYNHSNIAKPNVNAYRFIEFIPPFITLAAFAAVLAAAMPAIVRTFIGEDVEYYANGYSRRETRYDFIFVCLGALALHAAATIIGTLIYKELSPYAGNTENMLQLWRKAWMKTNTDAGHYLTIANNWYAKTGDNRLLLVFLPMYPLLIKGLNFIVGDAFIAAQLINTVATSLTAGMTYLTLRPIMGANRARAGAFIYLLLPGAIFMNSTMSEPLFMLFTVSAFYFMGRRKLILSGVFVALAGFTRSLGVLAAVPLAVFGIGRIVRHAKQNRPVAKEIVTLILALFISTLGTLSYLYINYALHGNPLQFFEFQKHWYQQACPFFETPRYIVNVFLKTLKTDSAKAVALWGCELFAIAASLLIVGAKAKRLPAHYTLYFLFYFAAAIGCTWLLSAVRYLSAALPVSASLALMCKKKWAVALIFTVLVVAYFAYTYAYMIRLDVY